MSNENAKARGKDGTRFSGAQFAVPPLVKSVFRSARTVVTVFTLSWLNLPISYVCKINYFLRSQTICQFTWRRLMKHTTDCLKSTEIVIIFAVL